MRAINETFGESFYQKLSSLSDLVVIMDESHHYRAEQGAAAIDDLKPVMGLELTATPVVMKNTKAILFKNVVYEYPLSQSIADGYTRTPFAMARTDLEAYNFGDEQIDKLMLADGIKRHEEYKVQLATYAANNNKPLVKPFAMVVCKNTDHANWVYEYITSDEFFGGKYKNKTIVVHSKQRGAAAEASMRALLSVERTDNPIEIVIHVDKLKEGWDVNNLYTIIPLRTAASKVLREQMVGRGLRLPYGERVGDENLDSVTLTAHDKFKEIIDEAKKGDSIFKAGNVIVVKNEEENLTSTQVQQNMFEDQDSDLNSIYQCTDMDKNNSNDVLLARFIETVNSVARDTINQYGEELSRFGEKQDAQEVSKQKKSETTAKVIEQIVKDKDLAEIYNENTNSLFNFIDVKVEKAIVKSIEKFIPIPRIKITDDGVEDCKFLDFDLDVSVFRHVPTESSIILQNLENLSDRKIISGNSINFEEYIPEREILAELRKKPEVDYESYSELIQKLINTVIHHYEFQYKTQGMKNIVMMNKLDIARKIYEQMMQHFYVGSGLINEEVVDVCNRNIAPHYTSRKELDLHDTFEAKEIGSILFTGIKYGVHDRAKFDSKPERDFAAILEYEGNAGNVIQWLRPAPMEFNITYNRGKRYEPDFVVETKDVIYLVEIKGEDKLYDPDVIAKKERSKKYCETVTAWNTANGYKPWKHLFIPSMSVKVTSTLAALAAVFVVE